VIEEPDEDLVERCRGGDATAFAPLVLRYQGPIYNAAFRVLGNAEDAAEVTQTVFLRIVEHLGEYDSRYRFFSWIYRIALNEALNVRRRGAREEPLDDDDAVVAGIGADPERHAGDAQRSRHIQRALLRLKATDRMMIVLRHFSDCSYREIGEALELDEKTVKSRLFEARQRLRLFLREAQAA
jgi:RNA polymerase sigma-70 factor (ECF subfamily)